MSSFLLPFQSCLSSSSYRTLLTPCFLCPYLTPNSLSSSSLFSFTLSSSPLSFTLLLISSLIHSPPHLLCSSSPLSFTLLISLLPSPSPPHLLLLIFSLLQLLPQSQQQGDSMSLLGRLPPLPLINHRHSLPSPGPPTSLRPRRRAEGTRHARCRNRSGNLRRGVRERRAGN